LLQRDHHLQGGIGLFDDQRLRVRVRQIAAGAEVAPETSDIQNRPRGKSGITTSCGSGSWSLDSKVKILMNVKQLAEVLLKAGKGKEVEKE